jgi:manganese transport protein
VVVLTVLPVGLYWLFASPVKMVIAGGIAQAVMLPLVGAGAVWLRHRRLPRELAPSLAVTVGLWAAAIFMAAMMAYYAWLIARQG